MANTENTHIWHDHITRLLNYLRSKTINLWIGVNVFVKSINNKQELPKYELPDNLLCIAHAGELSNYHYE